jgi:molybdopterin synthase sulfur carrier subunit
MGSGVRHGRHGMKFATTVTKIDVPAIQGQPGNDELGYLMEISVRLAAALARYANNNKVINCDLNDGDTLLDLVNALGKEYPGLKRVLCPGGGEIADSINIYVNGENVRYLKGLDTILKEGIDVNIIPSAAAG